MNRATNAAVMRAWNRTLILNLLRLGPTSRVELAERTQLTRASVTQIISELMEADLVEELKTIESASLGRRRTLLAIKHGARYAFGINICRKDCHVGAVDLYGDIAAEQVFSIEGLTPETALKKMAEIIEEQRGRLGLDADKILGIGVCTPGPVDYQNGKILNSLLFVKWQYMDICAALEELTGLPAILEKDTNARALEEKYFGVMKNVSNYMLVQICEGVGSGIMVGDILYRGGRGMGTELGHTSICSDGPVCSCGNRGCLENYLRIPVLLEGSEYSSWDELGRHAGEEKADDIIGRAADYLAMPIVNALNMFDLDKVALTGDIESCPEPLVKRLNSILNRMILNSPVSDGNIVVSGGRSVPARVGAMAVLYDVFQQRGII